MLEVCVLWSDHATHPLIYELKFRNGILSCNVSTRNQAAWSAFDKYQRSNNYLMTISLGAR